MWATIAIRPDLPRCSCRTLSMPSGSPAGLPVTVPTCRRLRSGPSRIFAGSAARERIEREATDETQTPEAALIAKLEAQHVRKAMASLPAPFHEVLVLTNSAARAASGGDE